MNKKALVLLSGGQDSTTCLFWALKQFEEVGAIAFDYGQKHKVELEQAQKIAEIANVPLTVVPLRGIFSANSALVDHGKDVAGKHSVRPDLPASFTSGRNIVFLAIAGSRALDMGYDSLVTGVCQTDYSGYPDCRQEFIGAIEVALIAGLDTNLKIHTPLMFLSKAETWKLANDLGCLNEVIEYSHTDYNGNREKRNEWGYGDLDNPASELRAKGFYEAKEKGWLTLLNSTK